MTTILSPRQRWILAWLLLAVSWTFGLVRSWHYFDDPQRADGNDGHVRIDFAGQWLLGHMLVQGHANQLYSREQHRLIFQQVYPATDQAPEQTEADADRLMSWCLGTDDPAQATLLASCLLPLPSVGPLPTMLALEVAAGQWTDDAFRQAGQRQLGGPLYPPIHAFLMAPLGTLSPREGYRLAQVLHLGLAALAGLALTRLSAGRLWWPLGMLLVTAFPGFGGSINLGQNAALSLVLLLWGWVWLSRGYPIWAGILWGLLAFKPVWAVAFLLVPVLSGRWRMALAMAGTGAAQILLTLPVVGIHSWLDWLELGREGAYYYTVDQNWIELSRDLLGVARRWMLDREASYDLRTAHDGIPRALGQLVFVSALGFLLVFTRTQQRVRQDLHGPGAAFLLLGSWLCCYHFIYYDVLLALLPVALLYLPNLQIASTRFWLGHATQPPALLLVLIVVMPNVRYVVPQLESTRQIPWDQYLLMLLWLWCAWCVRKLP